MRFRVDIRDSGVEKGCSVWVPEDWARNYHANIVARHYPRTMVILLKFSWWRGWQPLVRTCGTKPWPMQKDSHVYDALNYVTYQPTYPWDKKERTMQRGDVEKVVPKSDVGFRITLDSFGNNILFNRADFKRVWEAGEKEFGGNSTTNVVVKECDRLHSPQVEHKIRELEESNVRLTQEISLLRNRLRKVSALADELVKETS